MSRLKKFAHQIRNLSIMDINRVLQEIQLRLDSLEGVGQDKDMLGQRIVRVGDPSQDRDAINMRYLDDAIEDSGIEGLFQADRYDAGALGLETALSFGAFSSKKAQVIEPEFRRSSPPPPDPVPEFSGKSDSIEFKGAGRIKWRKITADSVTLSVGTSADAVSDLQTANDGNVYSIAEAAAAPAILLIVDFEGVKAFNWVKCLATYEGTSTHAVEIELYNWTTASWDHFQSLQDAESNSGTVFNNEDFFVPDDFDYIGTGSDIGNVRVRVDHPMSGDASHNLYIDCIALYQ